MWRSRFEEDWERRKQYLIRSLFEELPPLSPVPEEDESFDSPRATDPPRPYIPSKSTYRPNSPLPPLIIEKEPNRHDEPEEYYKKLEKKILKVYRKLFIELKSDISNDTSDEEVIEAESSIAEENNYAKNYMRDQGGSVINSSQDFDEDLNESNDKNNSGKASHNDSFNLNENEESQHSNESVTIQKSSRKRYIQEHENEASKSKKSKSIDSGSTTEVLPESLEEESHTTSSPSRNDGSRTEESEIQENDFRDHRVVEVVADIHMSAGSKRQALRAFHPVAVEANEDVDDVTVMLENNRVPDNVSSSLGCKRSWSSVSEESISYEDAGTQTHCDYERVNQNILKNIFVGPPKVYRLCSCVNHICVC